jgi:hypothetical protein
VSKFTAYLLLVLLLACPCLAKKKETLPKLIVNAKYVMVTSQFGENPSDPRVSIEDRHAIGGVQDAIQQWGRYTLVYERNAADIVLVVRTARVLEGRGGIAIGQPQPTPLPPDGPTVGNQRQEDVMGSAQDLLAVYDARQSADSAPLWQERDSHGLNPPEMRLVEDLRRKVEAAAQNKP